MNHVNGITTQLTGVFKEYIIHHEKPTLVEKFVKSRQERFCALSDINLIINNKERVGIIGPNGSGKTTLLKIIAGITTPTRGKVFTNGKIVSLIELGAGFHPDLSGYQNIMLNGLLLGMARKQISEMTNSIIEFANIRQFIDAPLYTYSNGMRLRLGFAISVHADPDILVLDEELSVGDKLFQQSAQKKIRELFAKNITMLIVSHNLEYLKKYCHRFLLLQDGKLTADDGINIIQQYSSTI